MNINYKNFPKIIERLNEEFDFTKVFKKYINSQFFIITVNNIYLERTIEFYYDNLTQKVYFELPKKEFVELSNKIFKNKIKQISQDYYQIIQSNQTKSTNSNDSTDLITDLKSKLEKIVPKLIPQIRVFKHKKKENKRINFMIDDLLIYTPSEFKDTITELLKSLQSNNQEQVTSNQIENNNQTNEPELPKIQTIADYPIFQKNYKDLQKNYIKEVLKKIPIEKLSNLQLYELNSNKKDKFNNPIKTNFKNFKTKSIVYYQKSDLSIIKQFLKQTKQGYAVKYCQLDRKQIRINNKRINLSNKTKIINNDIEYYINLEGKKYYQLALIDKNNSENNKKIIINHQSDLSKKQIENIKQTYQNLKKENNISKLFEKMYQLMAKLPR